MDPYHNTVGDADNRVKRRVFTFQNECMRSGTYEQEVRTPGAFAALASIRLALKAASRGVDRQLNKPLVCMARVVKVCKSDREGTVAGTRGNGEVAPKADRPHRLHRLDHMSA
jgi:hypothetical protein